MRWKVGRAAATTGQEQEAGLASRARACGGRTRPHMSAPFFREGEGIRGQIWNVPTQSDGRERCDRLKFQI
jgi:hypothetical protein